DERLALGQKQRAPRRPAAARAARGQVIRSVLSRLLLVACLGCFAAATLRAQPPPQPRDGSASQERPTASGSWQFPDDEEQAPGWREVVLDQAWDVGSFAAFIGLTLVSFFRKSVRLKYLALAAAVVYLGFAKSQLISIVNVFALIDWNLPIVRYSLGWYVLAVFTVASTVLWGRVYCGRVCAFGALTQLMDRILPAAWRRELPPRIERKAVAIKYIVLGGAIAYF